MPIPKPKIEPGFIVHMELSGSVNSEDYQLYLKLKEKIKKLVK